MAVPVRRAIRPVLAIDVVSRAAVVRLVPPIPWPAGPSRIARALLVAFAALASTIAQAQTEDETQSAPAEPVQVVPTAPPAPTPPVSEPTEAVPPTSPPSTPAVAPSPERPSPGEAAPAQVSPGTDTPTTPASPSIAPTAQPALAGHPRSGGSARKREPPRPAATLTIVNGRAVPATAVAVLAGGKVVARSGPLAANARVTLKLPGSKTCHVSVVATFPLWYSALQSGAVNVCKAGHALVRL
jgi:hypothetical protein